MRLQGLVGIPTRFILMIAVFSAPMISQAQSSNLDEARNTMELIFMCSVQNDTTDRVRRYMENTHDETMQREWNRAIKSSQDKMRNAQKQGGDAVTRALTRYKLSCQLVGLGRSLPIDLESAMYK